MGFFDNLDDPQKQLLLAMGLGLLQGNGRSNKNFAADLGSAGTQGLLAYSGAKNQQAKLKEEAQQQEMRALQMQQLQQANQDQQAMRAAAQRNTIPGQPQMQPSDMETPSGPQGPSTFNAQGYARDIMPINPMAGLDLQARLQKQEPMPVSLSEGARLVDPRTGREVANNPKHHGPKPGDLRHYDHGMNTLTYEFDGQKWNKIAEAPRFKPDGPDKPEKPPAGYRWVGENLQPIKGGPADPAGGKPTEGERTAAGYLERMTSAEKIMAPVEKSSGKPGMMESMAHSLPVVGEVAANAARSPDRQSYRQAQEDWVRAKLRKESGAVIADAEMDREIRTYFPQLGDSPKVIAQKAHSRQTAINAMRTGAGPVAPQLGVDDLLKKYLGR